MKNKLVYIAHPVGGNIKANVKKILKLCHDIHKKNDNIIPFVPYITALYYLNDEIMEERKLGMLANQEHFKRRTMDEVWICGSKISEGMKHEIKLAIRYKIPVKIYNPKLRKEAELIIQKRIIISDWKK